VHADPDLVAAARGERVRPVDRPGPQFVRVQVAGAQVQQRCAEPVAAGTLVLLDELDPCNVRRMPCAVPLGRPSAAAISASPWWPEPRASSRSIAAARSID
jgi:hypothetical protein